MGGIVTFLQFMVRLVWQQGISPVIALILPARCPVTGDIVAEQGLISPAAWAALTFISRPVCHCCGLRLPYGEQDALSISSSLCAVCVASPPLYTACRSAVVYDDASRPLILAFKHGDQPSLVRVFTPWLKLCGQDILNDADIIVPVPLHWLRLLKRRYNQSALLARSLSREMSVLYGADVLQRVRSTPPQGTLSRLDRLKNVRHAFAVKEKYSGVVKDKKIILIDDVYTTGATIHECCDVLLRAGAAQVFVLTLARVEKPEQVL